MSTIIFLFWGTNHLPLDPGDACNGPSTIIAVIACVLTPCTLLSFSCEAVKHEMLSNSTQQDAWGRGGEGRHLLCNCYLTAVEFE